MSGLTQEVIFDDTDIYVRNETIRLTPATYVDRKGEGEIHKINTNECVKIYLDPERAEGLKNKLTILREKSQTFHPSVVAPQELVFKADKKTVIGFSMRFIPDAQKLEDYVWQPDIQISEDKFDQQVANMLYDISDGLKAIHRSRVVVGDLKPDNILVSRGKAYIIDFDSASLLPDYLADSHTPEYVDPRLKSDVRAEPPYAFDPESDWWALGIVAFEMFLGTQPWGGSHSKFKSNKLLRAFNYSVVGFDAGAKTPPSMRSIRWFDNKLELKKYFQNLFSPDVFARHSIEYVLERYFPRPQVNRAPIYIASPRRKPTFDPEVNEFTAPVIKEFEKKPRTTKGRGDVTDDRDSFLDYMFATRL
jgi:serine/threonine protein kinase